MYSRDPQAIYWQDQAQLWIPRILGALAILVIAYILARAAKWAISKIVDRVPALKRHYEAEPGKTLGSLIGDIVFWLILLIGIMLALQPLGLSQVLEPVRQLTTQTFSFIPNLIGAGLIFVVGLVVAKILRRLVEGALLAANADGWLRRSGIASNAGTTPASPAGGTATVLPRTSISRTVGMLVFYIVMIPITIMALDALRIQVISGPATEMLQTIFDALPRIVAAVILLGIGYIVGKLAKQFIEQLLPSAGFDRSVSALGFTSESTTPSRTVGTIVMIAITLFFAIKAAELLQSPIIAIMLAQLLELGGRVLFGGVIILGGFVFAKLASNLVAGTGSEGWLPAILKWSIIALSVAMGLRFMGLANEIVIIAFASIIGSAAVACALAFGLGGRPTAHKLLEQWTDANRRPMPPARPRVPTPPSADGDPPLV
jgi:hypothetical protein